MSYLHQAGILIGWQTVDVFNRLFTLDLQEAGKALRHVVRSGNLLFPVAHVDPYHLK